MRAATPVRPGRAGVEAVGVLQRRSWRRRAAILREGGGDNGLGGS